MRVLTIASEVPPLRSGVARSVGRVVEGLEAAGHDVTLLSYADAPLIRGDRLRLSGLGVKLAVSRHLGRDFDVVHLHGPAPSVSDVVLARWRVAAPGVPLVYTHHFTVSLGAGWLQPLCRGYERLTTWLARAATVVVTSTPSYRVLVCGGPPCDCRVIPWGVDFVDGGPRPPRPTPGAGPLRVLLVGQLRRYKGHDVAIGAVRGLDRVELTIVGSGPRRAELEAATADVPNISMLSGVDDAALADLYAHHDVVLLPAVNRSEAFGIALLEGMAAGCVPVASDLPGVCDIAGSAGRLFPAGDSVALRSVLSSLAEDESDVAERADRARAFAADHPWERTVSDYVAVMAEITSS